MSDDLVARLLNTAEDAEIETSKVIRDYPSALREAADRIAALDARVAELGEALRQAERSRDEWKSDHKALSQAVVGDTGLSAMLVATQARLYRPRAESAEAALATALEEAALLAEITTAAPAQYNAKDHWRAEIGREVAAAIRAMKGGAA